MSTTDWTPRQCVEALAATPIEPLVLTSERQSAAFTMGFGVRVMSVWLTETEIKHSVSEWDHLRGSRAAVYYPPAAFPVLAARFALEHSLI